MNCVILSAQNMDVFGYRKVPSMKTLWQEFLQGLSSAFDFGLGAYTRPDFLASPKSDMEALVGDWEALCEDGRKAFGAWREVYHV